MVTRAPSQSWRRRWIRRPQTLGLRRVILQLHLWTGIGVGLYIFMISVTGSVLVYRNELYVAATRDPIISTSARARMPDDALAAAAVRAYPGTRVARLVRRPDPDQAVEIWLADEQSTRQRLFDPRTGADVGRAVPLGITLISGLMDLHDDLFAGATGRLINGFGAMAVLVMAATGIVIWWPGTARWRRSLGLRRGVGRKRLVWDLHSMIGFWSVGFISMLAVSGIYLCFPETIHGFANRIEPMTEANAGRRFVDRALYWLAFLHFGRIDGIGLPCTGPGLCDQATKALWAMFGLAPAVMFATGALMWWNRVVRRWLRRQQRPPANHRRTSHR